MNECKQKNNILTTSFENVIEKSEEITVKTEVIVPSRRILDNKIIIDSFESYNFIDENEKKEFMLKHFLMINFWQMLKNKLKIFC